MAESKSYEFKHVDQLVFGFTLPDSDSKSWIAKDSFHPKMKISNIALRWKIPWKFQNEDVDGSAVSDPSPSQVQAAPLISPCFSAGKDTCPSNWRIHILTNHCKNEEKMLSVFLEFYEYLEKEKFRPSRMNAIYIVRLLDPNGNILVSRRSGIRYFQSERLCYGWKPFVSLKSVQNLLESGELRVEVDLSILRCQRIDEPQGIGIVVPNSSPESISSPIISYPEDEALAEGMGGLSLELESTKPEAEQDKNIEWIMIFCGSVHVAAGNRKMMKEKSGYFRKKFESKDESVFKLNEKANVGVMVEIIDFINGDLHKCATLHSGNHDKLDLLYIQSRKTTYDIPLLRIACFNAMSQLIPMTINVDQALFLAIRAKSDCLDKEEECQKSMSLIRNYLMTKIMVLKHSQVMRDNQEYANWIAECLFLAD